MSHRSDLFRPRIHRHLQQLSLLGALFGMLSVSTGAQAATLNVPSTEFPTIQSAINAASPTTVDTIMVANGTYSGGLEWAGKDIVILGDNVIIDGGLGTYGLHTVNLSSASRLEGFTFQSCVAPYGGGMYNQGSSLIVANCRFIGNTALYIAGAVANEGPGSITFTGCAFRDNTAQSSGAIDSDHCDVTLGGCTFSNNTATYSVAGAVGIYSANASLTGCTFINNAVLADSQTAIGGALACDTSSVSISRCRFIGNRASSSYDSYGGGASLYLCTGVVSDCIFTGNAAANSGGGLYAVNQSDVTVTSCTFSGNSAASGAGIYNLADSVLTMANSIVWGNAASGVDGANYTLWFSDVQGIPNAPNPYGNISVDPLFVDADGPDNTVGTKDDNLRLQSGSPCIDGGDNSLVPVDLTTDLNGEARIQGRQVDQGAYETPADYSSQITAITALKVQVQSLVTAKRLLPADGQSLQAKLDAAIAALNVQDPATARTKLQDFINQVTSFIKTGKLTKAQGQPLIDAAKAILSQI